jgi:hypothetical protein
MLKKRPTQKSTRLAITPVCFSVLLVAPAGYLIRHITIKQGI